MTKVCLCKGVSEETIIKAINEGASTYSEVKEETGAGTGGCCGGRCKNKIEILIQENQK